MRKQLGEHSWLAEIARCASALLLCSLSLAAQDFSRYGGKPISLIRFQPERQPVPDRELTSILPLQVGQPYRPEAGRAAMGALFRTGRFVNIALDLEEKPEGLVVTFITEPAWFVGNVDVGGAKPPTARGELINAVKLTLGTEFEDSMLNQGLENVENELRLDGFYESKVRYVLERDPEHQQVNIRFIVDSGKRARLGPPVFRGTTILSNEALTRATRWKTLFGYGKWAYVSDSRIRNGIRGIQTLYRKKEYLMAKTLFERLDFQPRERVAIPSLRLEAGPKVVIRANGAKLNSQTLRRLVPIYEEQSVDKDLLFEGSRKIASFLRSKGYFDAKVEHEVEQEDEVVDEIDPRKDARIDFNIERGRPYKVASLAIRGNKYFDRRTLEERIAVRPATPIRYRKGRYSDELLAGDRSSIEDLYRANGFLAVKVTAAAKRQTQGKAGEVTVDIAIEEGPQTLIESLRFEGAAESDLPVLERSVGAAAGQPFSLLTIQADREKVLNLLYQNGYAEAQFESRAETVTGEPNRVRLIYRIAAGSQFSVRDVVITGLRVTHPGLVKKQIGLIPGEPLNNQELLNSQRRLYDLRIFAKVDTAFQNPNGQEMARTVLVNLEEASRVSWNGGVGAEIARIGGGITSLNSTAGGTGFSPRVSLGVNRNNFLGLGHTIGAQTRLSTIQKRVLLSYLAPHFLNNEKISITATGLYDDARNIRTYNSKRLEGSLQLAQRLSLDNSLQYRYTFRNVNIDQNSIKIDPALIPVLAQPVRVGSFSTTFIQDRRDDPTDAKRGRYTTIDAALASQNFGGSTNFVRLLGRNSSYYRIGRDFVFARSLTAGILYPYSVSAALTDQTNVPLPERFFGGGANSHRGFPENQAGPRDLKTGFPVGGKAIMVNNLEFRFPILGDNLGGVVFHDAGNVYSDISKISFRWHQKDFTDYDYMVHAVGFGLRYKTPIGPVRIDLAFSPNSARFYGFKGSLEDLLAGRGSTTFQRVNQFQFHISLGQAF